MIMKMDHLPAVGETVTDAEFYQVYGGKGANQAVAAARAGGDVAFVSCVGEDAYTPQMLKTIKDDGIDTSYVFHEKGIPSGHAIDHDRRCRKQLHISRTWIELQPHS
jgi:ribokinase